MAQSNLNLTLRFSGYIRTIIFNDYVEFEFVVFSLFYSNTI